MAQGNVNLEIKATFNELFSIIAEFVRTLPVDKGAEILGRLNTLSDRVNAII